MGSRTFYHLITAAAVYVQVFIVHLIRPMYIVIGIIGINTKQTPKKFCRISLLFDIVVGIRMNNK